MEYIFFNWQTNIDYIDLLTRTEVTTAHKMKARFKKRLRARSKRKKRK